MQAHRLGHYAKKAYQVGLRKTCSIIKNKITHKIFDTYWRIAAYQKKAQHNWAVLIKKERSSIPFEQFLTSVRARHCFIAQELYNFSDISHSDLVRQAHDISQHTIALLGSTKQEYVQWPWHSDFRLAQHNSNADHGFDASAYYKDITINNGSTSELSKDIKLPWELSRLQQVLVVAQAYELTKKQLFADSFCEQWQSWYNNNPFLLGPTWVCPMDVAIRAINVVLSFEILKHCETIDSALWQKVSCSLYDHLFYLENNWEYYDYRTSNHYLSDLIGYFYLCYFFQDLTGIQPKITWCSQEIVREFEKQVFDEGTDYEGSTAYHKLVTELFYHWYLLCIQMSIAFSENNVTKLQRMFSFLWWCMHDGKKLILVGDNDSGVITYASISSKLIDSMKEITLVSGIKHYTDFGLSIIKNDIWHSSVRHHAYHNCQPSGHFHVDIGHITVAYAGQPLFVDRGSYIYTPSIFWRNYFRNAAAHNMFYMTDSVPIEVHNQLFYLAMPENRTTIQQTNEYELYTQHNLYKNIQACRSVELSADLQKIIITDWWHSEIMHNSIIPTTWNFCLSPEFNVEKHAAQLFLHSQQVGSFLVTSTISYEPMSDWVSLEYGSKIPTYCLKAQVKVNCNQKIVTIIQKI